MKLFTKLRQSRFAVRYRNDFEYRTVVRTVLSSCSTAAIGTFNLLIALFAGGDPVWLLTLSAYYYALASARIAVLLSHRAGLSRGESASKKQLRDARNYLGGGAWLVLLTLCYSGIIVLVTLRGFHTQYEGNLIYLMALYAFWKVISATVNVVKYKKYGDYTVQTMRNLNLADGIVSIVTLQTALLAAFSAENDAAFAYTMNAAVGGVAGLILLALGSYMIVKGSRLIRDLGKGNVCGEEG